jgi:hypothetical protein
MQSHPALHFFVSPHRRYLLSKPTSNFSKTIIMPNPKATDQHILSTQFPEYLSQMFSASYILLGWIAFQSLGLFTSPSVTIDKAAQAALEPAFF